MMRVPRDREDTAPLDDASVTFFVMATLAASAFLAMTATASAGARLTPTNTPGSRTAREWCLGSAPGMMSPHMDCMSPRPIRIFLYSAPTWNWQN